MRTLEQEGAFCEEGVYEEAEGITFETSGRSLARTQFYFHHTSFGSSTFLTPYNRKIFFISFHRFKYAHNMVHTRQHCWDYINQSRINLYSNRFHEMFIHMMGELSIQSH